MQEAKSLTEWVAFLKEKSLPILSTTQEQLEQLGPLENISLARISNIVLTDPGLTLNLLRAASALQSKHLQGAILTVDNAIMLLGIGETQKLISQMQTADECLLGLDKEIYMQIVARTYHGAFQAYGMARIRVDTMPEEIFTASMLREMPGLMLLTHSPGIINDISFIEKEEIQQAELGFPLKKLSHQLATTWNLSAFIQDSFDEELVEKNSRHKEIHLAGKIAQTAENGWATSEMEKLIEEIASHLNISIQDTMNEIYESAAQSAEETPFYGVETAATKMYVAKKQTKESDAEAPQSSDKPSRETGILQAPLPDQHARNDAKLERVIHDLEQLLQEHYQLPDLMKLLKYGFNDALGLTQSFFAMLSKDRKHLNSRYIFGKEVGFYNLRIPIINGNIFERLLERPQALWVNEKNRNKVTPLIPTDFLHLIDVSDFFLMTISIKQKPVGIVYGDRQGHSQPLDKIDYEKFRELCTILAKGFSQISG